MARRCDQHPDMKLNLYCDTCHVPVCTNCCLLTHKQHEHIELKTVGPKFHDKLTELAKAATVHINKLGKQHEELTTSQGDVKGDTKKAHQEVDQAADETIDVVNKRRQYLHKQIDDGEERALGEIKAACKETELNKASTQSLLSYMQALQVSGNITDQVVHTPGLQEQLHQQETVPLRAVTWTASFKKETNSVAALDAMLGTVGVDHSAVTTPRTGDMKQIKLGAPIKTLKPPNVGNFITGMAVIGDCVCAVGWVQPHLWLHNTKTGTEKQHTLTGLSAVGMTALDKQTDNRTLVVTDNQKKMHFITISEQSMEMTNHTVKDLPVDPRHISVDPRSGKLLIANYSEKQIVICSNTGNIESRVKVQTDVGYMWCAVATEDGYVVLDWTNPGKIHWVDTQGRVTHTYGQGVGEGLNSPFHMLRDSQGWLVVADWKNHRLHLVDANKQLSCYLLTEADGIKEPTSVLLEETTSLLYVGCKDGNGKYVINVYKWPLAGCTWHSLAVNLGRFK